MSVNSYCLQEIFFRPRSFMVYADLNRLANKRDVLTEIFTKYFQ